MEAKDAMDKAVTARILARIGGLIRDEAKRRCPVDNGVLRATIYYRVEGNSVFIGSPQPYAEFVEYGTGLYHLGEDGQAVPHLGWDVKPIDAKALAFVPKGGKGMMFAKKAHIDGMHAQPFLRPAIHGSIPLIKEIIKEEITR